MSDYMIQQFFKDETLLSVSLGTDGMLGFFADNYPTIVGMTRAIFLQEQETQQKQLDAREKLIDARNDLEYLDHLKMKSVLSDDEEKLYRLLQEKIAQYELDQKMEDPIFFRGKPLLHCAEYEFIEKVEDNFPGIMLAMCEFDRLIRMPISNWVAQIFSWTTLPLKLIVGAIISRANLGVGGTLIYMLVEKYPDIIKNRMLAEEATGRPAGYEDYQIDGYSVKEKKEELITKYMSKDDDD